MKKKKNPSFFKKKFYADKTTVITPLIQKVEHLERQEGQPKFINMMSVDGKEVAFLGKKIKDTDSLVNNFIRVDRMVIPGLSRMVNIKQLKKQLPAIRPYKTTPYGGQLKEPIEQSPEDMNSIDVEKKKLFYKGKLQRNVILNTPGFIKPSMEPDRHFHHCHNYKDTHLPGPGVHPLEDGHSAPAGDNACDIGSFSPYIDKGELKHGLLLFYIDVKDFYKIYRNELERIIIDNALFAQNGKIYPFGQLQKILSYYFAKVDGPASFELLALDWDDKSEDRIKGFFLMPMLAPDQRIVHLCLINKGGVSNGGNGIKDNLRRWVEAVEYMNEKPKEREMYIGSENLDFAAIDQLAIFIGKTAFPVVKTPVNLHDYIRETAVKIKK